MAPSLANIALGKWEAEVLCGSQYMADIRRYLKFIDIFILWDSMDEKFNAFCLYLDSSTPFLNYHTSRETELIGLVQLQGP